MRIESPQVMNNMFFNGKSIGKSLKEVAVDLIQTEKENLISRWYHGHSETDLFTWSDQAENIIKQQLNFNGQVVEWNCLEGIKTGVIIESDMGLKVPQKNTGVEKDGVSETIQFDKIPQSKCVQLALEILHNSELKLDIRTQVISNFRNPQNIDTMPPEQFVKRFGLSIKNYQAYDHGFWDFFKKFFRKASSR